MRRRKKQFIERLQRAIKTDNPIMYMAVTASMERKWREHDKLYVGIDPALPRSGRAVELLHAPKELELTLENIENMLKADATPRPNYPVYVVGPGQADAVRRLLEGKE